MMNCAPDIAQSSPLLAVRPWTRDLRLLTSVRSESSAALDQVNDHEDDGNHDQEMDETAADVADEAEKPEHDQDNNYSPEHGVPFDLLNWPLLRHNVVIRSSKRSTSALPSTSQPLNASTTQLLLCPWSLTASLFTPR